MTEPIHIISLGAGVQSSTMALMAACGEITPMPKCAIFADTQDEPRAVYDWLKWIVQKLPFTVYQVTAGKLSENLLTFKVTEDGIRFNKTGVPWFTRNANGSEGKIKHRECTKDFKIVPINRQCKLLVKDDLAEWKTKHKAALKMISVWTKQVKQARFEKRNEPIRPFEAWRECQSDPLIVQWIGISTDELSRMKDSRLPWILSRWPLTELRYHRQDCLNWMKSKGFPTPPRSACIFCPFRNNHEWRRMQSESPKDFHAAVLFERELHAERKGTWTLKATPFIHRSLKPLDQVDFSTEEERGQLNMFNEECEGLCGV